ncbi:MAG: glycosyltransferase family 4 protein [Roseiflexus sp.]
MDIAFIDSWVQSSAEGSGTAVAIGGLQRTLQQRGIQVTRLAPIRPWPHNLTVRRLLFNLHVSALLGRLRYDLVIGFDIDGFLWSRRARRTPYLVSIKGVLAEESRQEQGFARHILWSLSQLERINARNADGVITTSAYCREAIRRNYGIADQCMRLVPEGIDLARWRRIARATPRRSDGATILCVARQYPRKHIADLLRAMPLVRAAVPGARAVIVGDGPEHARLRALAAELRLGEAVNLVGAIPDDDTVAQMYFQADVFCLPSVQEGFGIVFLEAMASGLPIVATTAAAIPEVVPHRRAGLLVPPGDVGALAKALIELLRTPDQRAAYGAFGMMQVEGYDWNIVADRFIDQVTSFMHASALHTVRKDNPNDPDKVDKVACNSIQKPAKVTQGTRVCP